MVRCQAIGCPLHKRGASASRQTLIGILGLCIITALATAAISSVARSSNGNGPRAPIAFGGSMGGWLDKIMPRRAGETDAATASVDIPDWTAASRVASFNCSGSLSAARSLVCSHWDLATVDYNMALVYRAALARADNAAALRAAQNAWLAKLDSLSGDRDALIAHYRARLEQLQTARPGKS